MTSPTTPTNPPLPLVLAAVGAATDRLLATVDTMSADDFAAPSLLPGWSRAHVLAHLALNAKGMAGVLSSVDHPQPLPMYASTERRDGDIEDLAGQPAARIADRLAVGSAVLAQHLGGGPSPEEALECVAGAGQIAAWRPSDRRPAAGAATFADAVDTSVSVASLGLVGTFDRRPGGPTFRLADLGVMRWREVEIHHADLALGYGPADWPDEFADYLLAVAAYDRAEQVDAVLRPTDGGGAGAGIVLGAQGDVIDGSRAALAWWLVGRGDGDGLTARTADGAPAGLPALGPWARRP